MIKVKYMLNYQDSLDLRFQALSEPARRSMLERLSEGPASVSELAQPLDMSLPAVMQHLRVLEESGLVSTRKQGRVRTCRLEPDAFEPAENWLRARRAMWERRLDRLETYLEEQQREEGK